MIPVLEAEQSMLAQDRIAMGTGSYSSDTAATIRQHWHNASARVVPAAKPKVTLPQKPTAATLAAIAARGVGIHFEPVKAPA